MFLEFTDFVIYLAFFLLGYAPECKNGRKRDHSGQHEYFSQSHVNSSVRKPFQPIAENRPAFDRSDSVFGFCFRAVDKYSTTEDIYNDC